jgi:hypothetical protein
MGCLVMREPQRTSVPVPPEVLEAADRAAQDYGTSRARVLSGWLQSGFRLVQQDALAAAYDDFYAEGDPDPVPREVRRERAARFDAEWA